MKTAPENIEGSRIECIVKKIQGTCCLKYKLGDKIIFDNAKITGKSCSSFLSAAMPTIYAMKYGVKFPWDKKEGETSFACPSDTAKVIFLIKRVNKR